MIHGCRSDSQIRSAACDAWGSAESRILPGHFLRPLRAMLLNNPAVYLPVLIARSGIRTSPDWEEAIPPKAGSQAAPILSSFSPAQLSCAEMTDSAQGCSCPMAYPGRKKPRFPYQLHFDPFPPAIQYNKPFFLIGFRKLGTTQEEGADQSVCQPIAHR